MQFILRLYVNEYSFDCDILWIQNNQDNLLIDFFRSFLDFAKLLKGLRNLT